METPCYPLLPPIPLPPQRVKFSFMVGFCWSLDKNIFKCLPKIIHIKIYEWDHLAPSPLQQSNSSFMMRFCSNLKPNIFICLPIVIEIEILIWRYVNGGTIFGQIDIILSKLNVPQMAIDMLIYWSLLEGIFLPLILEFPFCILKTNFLSWL